MGIFADAGYDRPYVGYPSAVIRREVTMKKILVLLLALLMLTGCRKQDVPETVPTPAEEEADLFSFMEQQPEIKAEKIPESSTDNCGEAIQGELFSL